MPIPSDARGITTNDLENESATQGVGEALCLLSSSDGTMRSMMQSTNGECSSGRGREGQSLLDDEIPAERNNEEYTKETRSGGESDQLSGVSFGRIREKAKCI